MTRTFYAPDQPPSFLARWASRLALFFVFVLPIALFLHRLFGLPTPVALNVAAACFVGAAVALVMAAVAGLDIWVTGRQGAARVVVATLLSLALLAVPVGVYAVSRGYPTINDVSSDVRSPPTFITAQKERASGANSTIYKSRFAELQLNSYPDIKTLVVPRGAEETYELVLQALSKLKLPPVTESAPDEETGAAGAIEFSDRTMVLGFTDDVVIRVAGDDTSSRVDVRSSSRYGRNDFGRNADRVRSILREISARVEASVPTADTLARARGKKSARERAKLSREKSRATKARQPQRRSPSR